MRRTVTLVALLGLVLVVAAAAFGHR